MLLPPLTRLTIGTIRQAETSGKRKCELAVCEDEQECEDLDEDEDGSAVTFKACSNGPFRKLSNLFGPVEWLYQRTKFKEPSAVYKYLTRGYNMELNGEWEGEEGGNFDRERIALGHKGKLKSYVAPDRQPASGLLAQHTSQIAKNLKSFDDAKKSPEARKRLTHILRTFGEWNHSRFMSPEEAFAWHKANVNLPADEKTTAKLMLIFLKEKFEIPMYADLLKRTGNRVIHERPLRGKPNLFEYMELTPEQKAKGFVSGGDLLGKLLTAIRDKL